MEYQTTLDLPDLTHPQKLIEFGNQVIQASLIVAGLVIFLGIAIALISFTLRRHEIQQSLFVDQWISRYSQILHGSQHWILVLILMVFGFFLCSTLSNRYHNWEQAKIAKIASGVAGERLEQIAPQIRYQVPEKYTKTIWVEGKPTETEAVRQASRFFPLNSSQIEVKVKQSKDVQKNRAIYLVDYSAEYQVINQIQDTKDFFFEIEPPLGYSLLHNFQISQNDAKLLATNAGEYSFPFSLAPGETNIFKVTYQAQGGPRWIYNANGQLLSNFKLNVIADFAKADFASGIVPTQTKLEGNKTQFTWIFDENVSVNKPFGVFTATEAIKNTGILPRLLLLAPALFLWWILMLYLSLPIGLKEVLIAAGVFFACLLSLTYFSRVIEVKLAWGIISPLLLTLSWFLGKNRSHSLAALIATVAGGVLPVFALIVTYSGLTFSVAGLLCVFWLAIGKRFVTSAG